MPRGTSLNDVEKGKILAFKEENVGVREIAQRIGRSHRVVQNFLKNPEGYGQTKRSGRKKKIDSRGVSRITRAASNSNKSLEELRNLAGTSVSRSTIWRVLQNSEHIKHEKMKSAPRLEEIHKKKRLDFARENMDRNWHTVIFSDEKKWNLDGPDGFRGYWRDLRKEPLYFSKRNFGGGTVMVWEAFSATGLLKLQFTSTRMNSKEYTDTLQSSLIPFTRENSNIQWIFQQDNAPIHISRETKTWFQSNAIEILEWPARSPDLNPVENLWGVLVRRIYKGNRQFDTTDDVKRAIVKEWNAIDRNTMQSLKKRIFDVILKKGAILN